MSATDFCTVDASTKRNQDMGSGITGAAIAHLASIMVTPLWSLNAETVTSLGINSPREFHEVYHVPASGAALPDIVEGDILVHGGTEYVVDHVAEWPDLSGGVPSLQIVVQEIKSAWPVMPAEEEP